MELGVFGMTLKIKPADGTNNRRSLLRLIGLSQVAMMLLWGLTANAQQTNRL